MTPSIPMPGPAPVKASELDAAVTGLAPPLLPEVVGEVVPALVVVVTGATEVVEVDPPPATAMTGAMGLPVGVAVVMPEAAMSSLG